MFALLVEVDNSGEGAEARAKGLRGELAPAMKQTPGFVSGVFGSDEAGLGVMLVVYERREQAEDVAGRLVVGMSPRPGVTIMRVVVFEVLATV